MTGRLALGLACACLLATPAEPRLVSAQRGANAPGARQGTSSISGRVFAPTALEPIRRALVVAESATGQRSEALTDESGLYRLDGLPAGSWRVTASKGGYVSWQFGQRRVRQQPLPVLLEEDTAFTADIPLSRASAITGHVYDEFGQPLENLQVRAYRRRIERGAARLDSVGVADRTDDTGAYRLHGLPPGDYYVGASLRVGTADSVNETTYAPTYYPGTGDLGEAQPVTLELGAEAAATFPLLPVRRARIAGVVATSAGNPAAAYLSLETDSAEFGTPIGIGGVTQPDGSFVLPDVPQGRYRISAMLQGTTTDETASLALTVTGEDITGLTLVTGPSARLRGLVQAEAGAGPLPPRLLVLARTARGGDRGRVLSSDDGPEFSLGSLTEPFYLELDDEGLDGWAVTRVTIDGLDALDRPVALEPGRQATARIVVTDRVTDLRGVVQSATPTDGQTVILFSEDMTTWGYPSRYIRAATVDREGRFRVRGLPPGDGYLAVATDYLEDGEQYDRRFLERMRNLAVRVPLVPGTPQTVFLSLVER